MRKYWTSEGDIENSLTTEDEIGEQVRMVRLRNSFEEEGINCKRKETQEIFGS